MKIDRGMAEVEEEREILKINQHFLLEKRNRTKFIPEHCQEYRFKRMRQILN